MARSWHWSERRPRALGGLVGPIAFVAAWLLLGRRAGYSPVSDPISRLAAIGAPTRLAMTGGLVAFGAGVATYSSEVSAALSSGAGAAAMTTAIASFGIAATPLDSVAGGWPHAAFAGISYAGLAALPLLAARPLARAGYRRASIGSAITGLVSATSLLLSVLTLSHRGLWQRLGLTTGDVWIMASSLWLASRNPHPGPSVATDSHCESQR